MLICQHSGRIHGSHKTFRAILPGPFCGYLAHRCGYSYLSAHSSCSCSLPVADNLELDERLEIGNQPKQTREGSPAIGVVYSSSLRSSSSTIFKCSVIDFPIKRFYHKRKLAFKSAKTRTNREQGASQIKWYCHQKQSGADQNAGFLSLNLIFIQTVLVSNYNQAVMKVLNAENVNDQAIKMGRVDVRDKRMINAKTDVNQLIPFKYTWAWESYLHSSRNHWMPKSIDYSKVARAYPNLHKAVAAPLNRVIGFMSLRDNAGEECTTLSAYRHITAPECRQFMLRQAFEESLQGMAAEHLMTVIGVTEEQAQANYLMEDTARKRERIILDQAAIIGNASLDTHQPEDAKAFLKAFIAHSVVGASLALYGEMIKLMKAEEAGLGKELGGELIKKIMRDRGVHADFGTRVIQAIAQEEPALWSKQIQTDVLNMITEAAEIEKKTSCVDIECKAFGLESNAMASQIEYTANHIAGSMGLSAPYPAAKNTYEWAAKVSGFEKKIAVKGPKEELSWDL